MPRPVAVRVLDASEWAGCAAALGDKAGDEPLPDLDEQIARHLATGTPVRLIEISDGEQLLALIPVLAEQRTVRGVPLRLLVTPGFDFFDYLPSPFRAGADFAALEDGLRRALALLDADALLLPHRLPALPHGAVRWQHSFANRYFDAALAENGWAGLTRKDSLRRHRNRARRELDYRVEHIVGRLPAETLATIAELHRERWAFDGKRSPFAVPSRPAEYMACAARALLSLVFDGRTLLAAHIGLRFGNTVIWHTPVINLRYLAYSPLEVLLLETAERCASTGVRILDFGLGDEPYKRRFGNATRQVVDLFVPHTWRGRLASFLLHRTSLNGLRQRLLVLKLRLGRGVTAERGDWLLPVAGDEESLCRAAAGAEPINEFSRLVDLFRAECWPLRREHYERLRRGETFIAINVAPKHGNLHAGVWCQVGAVFPAGTGRAERRFDLPTATLYDIAGCTPQSEEAVVPGLALLLSSGIVRQLVPAAAAAEQRIRLRRDEGMLRAALLAAGSRPD